MFGILQQILILGLFTFFSNAFRDYLFELFV